MSGIGLRGRVSEVPSPIEAPADATIGTIPLEQLHRWVNASSELVRALDEEDPIPTLWKLIAEQARTLLNLDMTAVLVPDNKNCQLLVGGASGLSSGYIAQLQGEVPLWINPAGPATPGPSVVAYRSHEIVVVPDISRSARMQPWREMAVREGYSALIAIPLDDSGVLVGYSTRRQRVSVEQKSLLALFAAHAGTALRAAQLHAGLHTKLRELHVVNEALTQQRRAMQRVDRQHRRLMQVMANNIGVAGVVTMLADLLDASVTLDDANGAVITSAAHGVYIAPPRGPQRQAPGVQKALAEIADQRSGSVELEHPQDDRARLWLAPVTLSEQVVAHLWIAKTSRPKAAIDRRGLELFAMAVALELAKQRNALQVRLAMSCELLKDILSAKSDADARACLERGSAMGHDLTQPYRVLVARVDQNETARLYHGLLEVVDSVAQRAGSHAVVGGEPHEVILLRRDEEGPAMAFADRLVREFKRLNPNRSASVVVGEVARDITSVKRKYKTARGALALIGRSRCSSIMNIADLGVMSLLLSHDDPDALVQFSDSFLAPVTKLEPKRSEELINTLQCWLKSGCSTSKTAERLIVHSNTVLYRLKTIETALGESLRNPQFLMNAELALAIREVARVQGEEVSYAS